MRYFLTVIFVILNSLFWSCASPAKLYNTYLKQKDEIKKIQTIRKLSNIYTKNALPYLIKILEKKASYSIKRNAIFGLTRIVLKGDLKTLQKIVQMLKNEKHPLLIEEYIAFIGEKGDNSQTTLLFKYLKNKSSFIRSAAVSALYKIGDKHSIKPLLKLFKNEITNTRESIEIRKKVLATISKLGDSSIIRKLRRILYDWRIRRNDELRQYVILSIYSIRKKDAKNILKYFRARNDIIKNIINDENLSKVALNKINKIKKSIRKNPNNRNLYVELGNLYMNYNKLYLAENAYRKANFIFKK